MILKQGQVILKQPRVAYVECTNGDLHLILKDLEMRVGATNGENLEAVAIKKIMKEEALKPLFLMRDE